MPGREEREMPSVGRAAVDTHIQDALEVERRPKMDVRSRSATELGAPAGHDRLFFVAEMQPDGTYSIALTEEGLQPFETALGIADDLGGNTRISPQSTIADIMERTAVREELSRVLRQGDESMRTRLRIAVLRRRLRGSERPSSRERLVGHLGKMVIIAVVILGALLQFGTAIADIAAIPGILAGIPSDILNFHPTSAFGEVGDRIADAGRRVLFGVLIACCAYILARLIRPFDRIYRIDQIVPGERPALRLLDAALARQNRGQLTRR